MRLRLDDMKREVPMEQTGAPYGGLDSKLQIASSSVAEINGMIKEMQW